MEVIRTKLNGLKWYMRNLIIKCSENLKQATKFNFIPKFKLFSPGERPTFNHSRQLYLSYSVCSIFRVEILFRTISSIAFDSFWKLSVIRKIQNGVAPCHITSYAMIFTSTSCIVIFRISPVQTVPVSVSHIVFFWNVTSYSSQYTTNYNSPVP